MPGSGTVSSSLRLVQWPASLQVILAELQIGVEGARVLDAAGAPRTVGCEVIQELERPILRRAEARVYLEIASAGRILFLYANFERV